MTFDISASPSRDAYLRTAPLIVSAASSATPLADTSQATACSGVDASEVVADLIDDITCTLLEKNDAAKRKAGRGRSIDEILAERQADLRDRSLKSGASKGSADVGAKSAYSDKEIAGRKALLIKKASQGKADYVHFSADYDALLKELSAKKYEDLTHHECKKLLKAGGVTNIASAHWGSAFDAFLTAFPEQFAKIPARYTFGSVGLGLLEDVVTGDGFSHAEISVARGGANLGRGTSNVIAKEITKRSTGGFFGMSIPPEAQDLMLSAEQLRQIETELKEFNLAHPDEIDRSDSLTGDAALEAIRNALISEFETRAEKDSELAAAFGTDARQRAMLIAAFAIRRQR